jgi:asparagine synthase (glutamine-hydrolysing)
MGARWYPKFDYLPQVFRAKSLLRGLSQELADAYCASMRGFGDEQLDAVLSPELRTHRDAVRDRFRNAFDAVHHLPPLQQMQAVDLETYLPGDILVKMDRATMAHSLEARAPMLDHRLAELAASLPARFKLQGNNGKHILKKAVEPYLPAAVITRRKAGFSVPLAQWFRTSLKPVFESSVTNRDMEEFVNLVEVRRLWKEHQSGLHNHDRKLWHLLMLAQWREHHLKPQAVAAVADAVAR